MADAEHVELQLQEALAAARSRGDAAQARTAYTQAGLAHYARQRYDEAIRCFEAQVRSIAAGPQVGDADLEALSFAFRLLAQLHMELGQEEHAGAYARRSKEVQVCGPRHATRGAYRALCEKLAVLHHREFGKFGRFKGRH